MKQKMKRQAMNVSINDLRRLVLELTKEGNEFNKSIGIEELDLDKKWLVSIINKTPKCSDTWKIEQ